MDTELARVLSVQIRSRGPARFDEVVEAALYHPTEGFFSRGGGAGRHGDFITSPEVGPLFGAVVARALDDCWRELGEPDPFTVVDAGAGRGALAIAIRAAEPACSGALSYVLVERSAALRELQGQHLAFGAPNESGARFESLADLPEGPLTGVVLANELLDNLPFRLVERTGQGWSEVLVGFGGGALCEELGPAPLELSEWVERLAPEAPLGARVPVQHQAMEWLDDVLRRLGRGRVVVFDYMTDTQGLAGLSQGAWLRTYRGHERGGGTLQGLGEQDITSEVCLDQLGQVRPPTSSTHQAAWLRRHGIEDLVEEGRRAWTDRSAIGDLQALRARSRVGEAEALLDPDGLGAFTVAEWVVS